jgi:hypothetical protein
VRVEVESCRLVLCSEHRDGISGHVGWRWDVGNRPAVRIAEPEFAVRLAMELISLLVHGAVVTATEQRKIRERGGAALSPVSEVMALAKAQSTAWKAAAAIAVGAPALTPAGSSAF